MNKNNKTILVTGATGNQGGAVVQHLLKDGWKVRALTRDVNSEKAQALATTGVEVVSGNLDDKVALDSALREVYGVYSFPNMSGGLEAEILQGKLMADAAKAAGIKHFIQGSVGSAERETGVPHFESKWKIEEYVRSLDLSATIIRPVYFMDNLNWTRDAIMAGNLPSMSLDLDKSLQMIAVDDIGGFTALVFSDPDKYIGKSIELAGDELTETQIAETLSKVIGRKVTLGEAAPAPDEDMKIMMKWFNTDGYKANIASLRETYPDLMTLETWLEKNGWGN